MAETVMSGRTAPGVASEHRSIAHWEGWHYLPGLAFVVLGVLALIEPSLASIAAGLYLGATLCVAGGFMLAGGIAGIRHRGGWLGVLLGLLTLAAGLIVLVNPIAGAISLVWVLGAWFVVGGFFELAMGFSVPAGRGWLLLIAVVDIILGAVVIMMSPAQAFAFLGILVGISLILRGMWSLAFTSELHHLRHAALNAVR
jgi:uncharacterized membrane protein HdeD (DUF308 family)